MTAIPISGVTKIRVDDSKIPASHSAFRAATLHLISTCSSTDDVLFFYFFLAASRGKTVEKWQRCSSAGPDVTVADNVALPLTGGGSPKKIK